MFRLECLDKCVVLKGGFLHTINALVIFIDYVRFQSRIRKETLEVKCTYVTEVGVNEPVNKFFEVKNA